MYSKFPLSIEHLPRQRRAGCLSLKIASLITALLIILYSLLALAQCSVELIYQEWKDTAMLGVIIIVTIIYGISFVLSAFMLLGVLREKAYLIRPWVIFKSMFILTKFLFLLWGTVNILNHIDQFTLQIYMFEVLGLLVSFYMLVIVSSYCKELEEDVEETARLKSIDNMWYSDA